MSDTSKTVVPKPETPFSQALFPVLTLVSLIVYGLMLRPMVWGQSPLPLEIIFIVASTIAVTHLVLMGHRWMAIQATIVAKFMVAMPAFFILLSIGLVIGSWIVHQRDDFESVRDKLHHR